MVNRPKQQCNALAVVSMKSARMRSWNGIWCYRFKHSSMNTGNWWAILEYSLWKQSCNSCRSRLNDSISWCAINWSVFQRQKRSSPSLNDNGKWTSKRTGHGHETSTVIKRQIFVSVPVSPHFLNRPIPSDRHCYPSMIDRHIGQLANHRWFPPRPIAD